MYITVKLVFPVLVTLEISALVFSEFFLYLLSNLVTKTAQNEKKVKIVARLDS